jgi:hypothetical protein
MYNGCMRMLVALISLSLLFPVSTFAVSLTETGKTAGVEVSTKPPVASAEAVLSLPSVYVLPGTPFYWFREMWESLQLIMARSDDARAELLLEFAERRLAEGYQAVKDGRMDQAIDAAQRYRQQHQQAIDQLAVLAKDHKDVALPLLQKLDEQLKLQQNLQSFVLQRGGNRGQGIAALLNVPASDALALAIGESAVLGALKQQAASASATPSAAVATNSAVLTPEEAQQ